MNFAETSQVRLRQWPGRIRYRAQSPVVVDADSVGPARSCRNSSAEIENGHPDCETVRDLVENHALDAVRDFTVDFDSAIDWTGMHDQTIGFQKFCPFFGQAEKRGVLTDAREIFLALTLMLNPQQIDHVSLGQDLVDLVRDLYAQLFKFARDQGARTDQRDLRSKFR